MANEENSTENNDTLRSLLRQNMDMLTQHMRESNDFRINMTGKLAKMESDNEYAQKTITSHAKDLDTLKSAHNKQKGAMWAMGVGSGVGIIHALKTWIGL